MTVPFQKTAGRKRPRVHWCPTGSFAHVPLHAAGVSTNSGHWCSDYMVSSYTPTLTALIEARRHCPTIRMAELRPLLIAEPTAPGLPFLENVVNEIQAITDIIAPSMPSIIGDMDTCGAGAQLHAVLAQLPHASIVHLACHAEQNDNEPLESGFCLRDGRLTVASLMQLALPRAFFAFLGACETAKGDRAQPDQAVHLAAAMLFVGFRSVIATMW